ncbi:MAG: translation initiation factor IF-5A [Nanoarchaeota archaeon]
MVYKLIDATGAKAGTVIMIDNEACIVRNIDISKTGKHGSSKCRIEAVGIIDGKKRVLARPGHERFEVPMIDKKKAQILSLSGKNVNVMDIESFETFDLPIPTDIEDGLKEGVQVEYWDIEGKKVIKRVL